MACRISLCFGPYLSKSEDVITKTQPFAAAGTSVVLLDKFTLFVMDFANNNPWHFLFFYDKSAHMK